MEYIQKIEDFKIKPLCWQKAGKQYTVTGYGGRIPTEYMIKINGRWHRVYCSIYSNNGALYVIKKQERKYVEQFDIYKEQFKDSSDRLFNKEV